MAFFGLNFPEDDDGLKDLSIELTHHKEWLDRIETQGNKPESWVEFIEHTKSQFSLPYHSFRNSWICDLYVKALKSIPGDLSKNNVMFVKLWIDYANLKSEDHVEDGHVLFSQARSIARKFAIAHIAAAEFELKQGNKAKCQKILEKAEIFSAEPASLLKKAFQNLKAGKSYLLTASDKSNYFEKKTEIEEEKKPTFTQSVSLPERSMKNKFLVSMMASHAPVISNPKSEPQSSSEKVFQPTDPFGSSEKWVSGSLLSEKWGSCSNFPSDGRLSNIFSDRRLSSLHNVGDRRTSSIHTVADRRLSNIHSVATSHAPPSSVLSHQTTPDSHNPYRNSSDNNSSGSRTSSSISRLFNVTSLPRRVKIDSKNVYDELNSDEDETSAENNTMAIHSGKAAPSGFRTRYCINPIEEEGNNAIGKTESSLNGQQSLKAGKFEHKSSSVNEKNKVNINPFSIDGDDDDDDDDIPQLPTPPKLSLSFMRNRCENANVSSASLSTPSASSVAEEKTKPSTALSGRLKGQTSLNKHSSETNNITPASTSGAQPHFFAEPRPVAKFVKPSQPKCHPDTPRPDTGTPPVPTDKENFVAPPPQTRRCLDSALKSSSPATADPNPNLNPSPATADSLTMTKTISPCTITVRENITDTVVFEEKAADFFQTPSELQQMKMNSFQGTPSSSLSLSLSSSLINKRPYLSDINPFYMGDPNPNPNPNPFYMGDPNPNPNPFYMGDKLDTATAKPDPLLYCDKQKLSSSSSHVTSDKLSGRESSWTDVKEGSPEPVKIAPAADINPNKLSNSSLDNPFRPNGIANPFLPVPERPEPRASSPADVPTVVKPETASERAVSYEAKRVETFLHRSVSANPKSELHRKEPQERDDKMFNAKVVEKQKVLTENHSKEEKPPSQKEVERLKNEIIVQQSLVNQGKENKAPEVTSGKGPPIESEGPPNNVQLKEQRPAPVQSKAEPQAQKSQQNRVENPVSNSGGSVNYTMSLNQPITSKKHRSLTVNDKTYMILKMIGRGGSSKVYQVLDESYNMMAVKHIDFEGANEATVKSYMNEVTLLKRLQYSDLVVKLYDFELDYEENCIYLVLECGETDLATMFKNRTKKEKIPREMVKFYWGEMLRAVQVLHKEGIVHSDLKPANFLIIGGNLKLIDFGIAGVIQNDRTSMTRDTQMGTLNYMSPETILEMQSDTGNRLHKFKISVKSDVWSLGCILYSMIYGKTPFQHITNPSAKLQAIINVHHNIEFGDEYNTDLVDTMKKCLCRNPKERLSISELLQHPYLAEKTKAAPSTPKMKNHSTDDSKSWVADVQCIFDKLVDANVASPNTISTLKKTLFQKLSSKKEINEVLSQLPRNMKPDVNVESENIGKIEPKLKCANNSSSSVKEVRTPLQCLNLKDLRRE